MELRTVDPRTLIVNPENPRRSPASPVADEQMAASIKVVGIIQPPIVKETADGLEIVYGERRVKGAITNGLATIAALMVEASTSDHAMAALVENVVRAPLSPVDQWRAIHQLEHAGWNAEAISTTLALPLRTIRKLKLLASIHPPMLDHIAQGELPNESDLRTIANASLEEQATVWKKRKPKKGERVAWYEISRALQKRRLLARDAKFDDELARAFGIVWYEDLFAPADEDSRYTTQVDEFLAAQQEWLTRNLPPNGVVLAFDQYGQPKLPPKAQRLYGDKPRKTDKVGHYLNEHSGEIGTVVFRPAEPPTKTKGKPATDQPAVPSKPARPLVTKKGNALIGDLRTEALHQALHEAQIDDQRLIGLLILALAANNVSVTTPVGCDDYGGSRARSKITAALTAGGALTQDADTLRQCARDMLAAVLSCRVDVSSSGNVARHVGVAIDADRYLANMATEEFLSCLSKTALNDAAQANAVTPCERAKDTRAAMIRAFKQRTYLYPEACFALSPSELAGQQRWSTQMVDEPLSADPDTGSNDDTVDGTEDSNAGVDDSSLDDGIADLESNAEAV
jgi:ParB family chromosome partitioning protein